MKVTNWKVYAVWIAICEAVGFLSGWLSREGQDIYNVTAVKPAITPPDWVFPVVWIILFALMGISAARVSLTPASKERSRGLNLFTSQLIVNFFWPLFFFNLQAFEFSLIWLLLLLLLVVLTFLQFRKIDHLSGWVLIPYIVWLIFAVILNWRVSVLN